MTSTLLISAIAVMALISQTNAAPALCGLPPPCLSPLSALAGLTLPAELPCPAPAPIKTQKPDLNLPLPLPAKIPLGNFCTCQKIAIKPLLLPCAPVKPCAPPLPISLCDLQALLAKLLKAAPACCA